MAKKGKKRAGRKPKSKPTGKRITAGKIFIYALALAALSGGGYLAYDKIKRRRKNNNQDDSADSSSIIINNNLPAVRQGPPALTTSIARRTSSTNDNFPLRRGSQGTRVTMLQQALAKNNATIKVDGQFGAGTASALKTAGYPEVIDETIFNKITGAGSIVRVVFNPADLATRLYSAAQRKGIDEVLSILKEIKSVQDYSSVNEYYKKQGFFISRTIVTDLLDYAFKSDSSAKDQIRNEFLRIGLKLSSSGTWTLQGISLYKDLITLRQTIVIDGMNNRIPVRRNTILGDEIEVANGMTWFRSVDNTILKAPTRDVKYT